LFGSETRAVAAKPAAATPAVKKEATVPEKVVSQPTQEPKQIAVKKTAPEKVVSQPTQEPKQIADIGTEEKEATVSEKIVNWPGGKPGETVIVNTEEDQGSKINPFSVTKIITIFLAGVVFGAFLFDFFLVSEKRIPRLSGRSFAQLLFLGFILLIIVISRQGAII